MKLAARECKVVRAVLGLCLGLVGCGDASPPALKDAAITVDAVWRQAIIAPERLEVVEGGAVMFPVTLAQPPMGDLVVTVTSIDPARVMVSPVTLTFNATNFASAQLVTAQTLQDSDLINQRVVIVLEAPSAPSVGDTAVRIDLTDVTELPSIIVTPPRVDLTEGSSQTIVVHLSFAPAPDPVEVYSISTPADLIMVAPATLRFDSGNFSTNQALTLTAPEDGDTSSRDIQLQMCTTALTGSQFCASTVTVHVIDND